MICNNVFGVVCALLSPSSCKWYTTVLRTSTQYVTLLQYAFEYIYIYIYIYIYSFGPIFNNLLTLKVLIF